ncbi:hypothetical protein [Deinococcus sp. Leaf326]|uniref:hypothetical protein n=1 Tax=Deinococcus sp. Leaf326 TaxID=1736338 RepID=UPI000701C7BC|nr:hypothetical protein [Deinococcus sp. Leaf326]KQR37777.1 hypothetical protein ASF71_14950 [Deinococcus sp. Leaf326]
MSHKQALPRGSALSGPRDDLKVLEVLSSPLTLPLLERRLGQAGHRIDATRLRVLLTELQDGHFIQISELEPITYTRTALGTRLCGPCTSSSETLLSRPQEVL